jgi:DNA-directed RNA polymerase specialized sigma24 family protein
MSWFEASMLGTDARNPASTADVLACFQDERSLLSRLAFLITGDQSMAEQCVVNACEITLQGNSPFRDWLLEWAKAATIASAISRTAEAIRACEASYKNESGSYVKQFVDNEDRAASLKLILEGDPEKMIAELDPLCRAVLVLRVAIGSSIQDCVLRLNVCRAAVVTAASRAMAWLYGLDDGQVEQPENLAGQPVDSAGGQQ